jgi:type II secretory pathway pseudopilin PulG
MDVTSANVQQNESTSEVAPRGQRKGFTLISLMVAVVLLSTGVMAIGAANTTRIRTQTMSSTRSAALSIARTYLERVRGRDVWSIAEESEARVDASGDLNPAGAYTRRLQVTVERQNLLRVEVIVTGPRMASPIRLVTNTYRGGTLTPIL